MNALQHMEEALERFIQYRVVFEEYDIRPDGFSLPRQHSLFHYIRSIKLFGSPNGLCSSITESKHITAVKKPWRASSRNKPLIEILKTNVRNSKISAARSDFGHRGMLYGDVLTAARVEVGFAVEDDFVLREDAYGEVVHDLADDSDVEDVEGEWAESFTRYPARCGMFYLLYYNLTNNSFSVYSDCKQAC